MSKRQAVICVSLIGALITLFIIFYDLKVSSDPLSKPKNPEICKILAFDFFNCESTCDLTNVPASIFDRKIDARPFKRLSTMSQSCAISFQRPKSRK